jgi:hypothetical protein
MRLEALAEAYAKQSDAAAEQGHRMASVIPFGQPILIGHHSEGRDRRYRDKIDRRMRQACELDKKAKDIRYKLEAAKANTAISSDDPNAIEALRAKLEKMEALQAKMVAANKLVRKKDRAGLAALMGSEKVADELFKPDFCGRLGFADFEMTNNNANIKRVRLRIAQLEAAKTRDNREFSYAWGILRQDVDLNRVMFLFNERQPREIVDLLKSYGFKWSPTNSAWQRMLNNSAVYAAGQIRSKLNEAVKP